MGKPMTGAPIPSYQSAVSNTAIVIATGKTFLEGFHVENNTASDLYLQFFDSVSPTVGTTPPVFTLLLKGSSNLPADVWPTGDVFMLFANGISVAATTTRTGSTAPATAATATIWYCPA